MSIHITECPRDAMQGIKEFIPTDVKANYINKLLKVGFDVLDFGSFVSPYAIPQMKDTPLVISKLDLTNTQTRLLSIIANMRGATDACFFDEISILGFPFSVSETFQKRNTNSTIEESLGRVEEIQNLCIKNNKTLLVYLSMGFGNPYGDPWNPEIVTHWANKLAEMGITNLALADTVGAAKPEDITNLFSHLIPALPHVNFGAHLHTKPNDWHSKVDAAYQAGCRNFDAAMKGFGGCPMADDKLTGNFATENLVSYCEQNNIATGLDMNAFREAMEEAGMVFAGH